jgi:hypothetical protein
MTNLTHLPAIVQSLLETFEPLVSSLDGETNDYGNLQKRMAHADAGYELPSSKDNGMKFLIGGICQSIWRQTHGVIKNKDGQVFDNVKQRLAASEKLRDEVARNIEKGIIDERDLKTIHWFKVNEARYEAHENLLQAFATLYHHIFNEAWKPYNNEVEATNAPGARKTLTEAEKEQYLKSLGLTYTKKEPESVLIKSVAQRDEASAGGVGFSHSDAIAKREEVRANPGIRLPF